MSVGRLKMQDQTIPEVEDLLKLKTFGLEFFTVKIEISQILAWYFMDDFKT